MPSIPVYSAPTVAPTELPGVRQVTPRNLEQLPNIGRSMQAMGSAMLQAGNEGMAIATREQIEANEARVKEDDANTLTAISKILYDPERGYMNRKGKDALDDNYDDVVGQLQGLHKASDDGLQNRAQQQMASTPRTLRVQAALQQAAQHKAQQVGVYQEAAGKIRIQTATEAAVSSYSPVSDTPLPVSREDQARMLMGEAPASQYQLNIQTIRSEAQDQADRKGLTDPDLRKAFVQDALRPVYMGVLAQMLDGKGTTPANFKAAEAYFKAVKDELSPEQRDRIKQVMDAEGTRNKGLELSRTLKGSFKEQLSALGKMFDNGEIRSEVYDDARRRVEHNEQLRKQEVAEANKGAMGAAQEWILRNPGKSVMDMPPRLYNWAKQEGHLAGLDSFAQREGRAGDRMTELQVRGQLLAAATTDPDAFIKEFRESGFLTRTDLGAAGIKEMQGIATDMLQNSGRWRTHFDQKVLQDAIPKDLLKPDKKDQRDAFVALMAERQSEWIKANPGRAPDQAAYQKVVAAANEEWIGVNKYYWDSSLKAYEARGNDRAVPKSFFDAMKAKGDRIAGRNSAPNDESVVALFQKMRAVGGSAGQITEFYTQMKARGLPDKEMLAGWQQYRSQR